MPEAPIQVLEEAVGRLHGGTSTWVEAVPFHETLQGRPFGTAPTASRAHAWSHHVGRTERRRLVAVLLEGQVDSPLAAVQPAIAADGRARREPPDVPRSR